MVASRAEEAILYNDNSVLENYHACQACKLMHKDGYQILKSLSPADQTLVRRLVIKVC